MLKDISRTRLVGYWFTAVVLIAAVAVVAGVKVNISTAALLLAMCLVPPAILFVVWRGAPPSTVGELLYAADAAKDGRS